MYMSRFDQYEITFEWSDESETSFSCRAGDFHAALAEAMDDPDAMSPADENSELLTVTINNKSAAARQDSYEADEIYSQ
jgi:hypothetical protein